MKKHEGNYLTPSPPLFSTFLASDFPSRTDRLNFITDQPALKTTGFEWIMLRVMGKRRKGNNILKNKIEFFLIEIQFNKPISTDVQVIDIIFDSPAG